MSYVPHEEFSADMEANNKRPRFKPWYLKNVLPRGWQTFRHLPNGTRKKHLLGMGGMIGFFVPAYCDLLGYGRVTVLEKDAPTSGRVTIGQKCKPWNRSAVQCALEKKGWPFSDKWRRCMKNPAIREQVGMHWCACGTKDWVTTCRLFLCEWRGVGADVMIAGFQKALACSPGVSMVVLGPRALARVERNRPRTFYLDLKAALVDGTRGQTPFTPAVGTLRQIHARLKGITVTGGAASEVARTRALAEDFRQRIRDLPLEVASEAPSNAAPPLHPSNGQSAYGFFEELMTRHGIWVCPNGGALRDELFRVGHMGNLTPKDNENLVEALTKVLHSERKP